MTGKITKIIIAVLIAINFAMTAKSEDGEAQPVELLLNLDLKALTMIADNVTGKDILEVPVYDQQTTVLISGKDGKLSSRVGGVSTCHRFSDLDGDGSMDVAQTTPRMMATSTSISYYKRGWVEWNEEFFWEAREAVIFTVHDFNGDSIKEILGATGGSNTGMTLNIYNIVNQKTTLGVSAGTSIRAILADVDGNGRYEIAATIWNKNPEGKFEKFDMFGNSYMYDIVIAVINPVNGEIISMSDAIDMPASEPMAADLSGTGKDDVILIASDKLFIYSDESFSTIYRHSIEVNIDELRSKLGNAAQIPEDVGSTFIYSPKFTGMAVGDFNSSRGIEIVAADELGYIVALDSGGNLLWETELGVSNDPVIADFNGDGKVEVIVPVEDGSIYGLDGETGDTIYNFTTVIKKPELLVADLNSDRKLELLVSGRGLSVWTMKKPGKVEWACVHGDAEATGNYKLSREYSARIADTKFILLFPYFYEILIALIVLALIGAGAYGIRRLLLLREEVEKSPEMAGQLARLENAYLKEPSSPKTVLPLAKEYAKSNAIGIRANEVYRKAVAIAPDDAPIAVAFAKALLSRNALTAESERMFQRAMSLIPKDLKFVEGLVNLLTKNNRANDFALNVYHVYFTTEGYNIELVKVVANTLMVNNCADAFSAWLFQVAIMEDTGNFPLLMALLAGLKQQNQTNEYLVWAARYIADQRLNNDMRTKIAQDLREWGMEEDAEKFAPKF